jgi:hypothetical protein
MRRKLLHGRIGKLHDIDFDGCGQTQKRRAENNARLWCCRNYELLSFKGTDDSLDCRSR